MSVTSLPSPSLRPPWLPVMSGALAFLLLAGAFARHAFEIAPNHDNVWLLISAQRLVDGGHYYSDFFELNPPLYIILISPALFIADLLGVDDYTGFIVWILALIGGSAGMAYRWLAALAGSAPRLIPLLMAMYVGTLAWTPDYSFGQREHVTAILVFPYMLWLFRAHMTSATNGAGVLATIGLAALGFLIKPHFLIVPVALVTAHGLIYRQWSPLLRLHVPVFGLAGSLYTVAMLTVFTEWFDVTAITLQVYDAYSPDMIRVLFNGGLHFLATASIWIVAEMLIGGEKARAVGRMTAVAAAAFLIAVTLQRKGFPYHYLPVRSLNFLAFGVILSLAIPDARRLLERMRALPGYSLKSLSVGIMAVALALSMLLQVQFMSALRVSRAEIEASGIYAGLAELATDGSAMIMAVSLGILPTVSLLDLEWQSRMPAHWIVPGIVKLEQDGAADAERLAALRRLATGLVVEDFRRYAPSLVVVYTGPHRLTPRGFDLLSFYRADPAFAALWSSYRHIRTVGRWRFYALETPASGNSRT